MADDGRWSTRLDDVAEGIYRLRVDQLARRRPGGEPRRDPLPARLSAPAAAPPRRSRRRRRPRSPSSPATISGLWRETHYGSGVSYTQIFTANRDQIRDPDLIYPGQIFNLPEAGTADRSASDDAPIHRWVRLGGRRVTPDLPEAGAGAGTSGWRTIRRVAPYLWPPGEREVKARVLVAMAALVLGRLASVVTPFFFKAAVDGLAPADPAAQVGYLVAAGPGGAHALLRAHAARERRLHPAPRRRLRAGGAGRPSQARPRELPARPCPQPALPHRAQDRRPQPHHRARGEGRRLPAALPALLHRAARARAGAGGRHPLLRLRRLVPRRGGGHHLALRLVHDPRHRVAARHPRADERARYRRQPEGRRQPAELRDREVLQRRGARGRTATTPRCRATRRRRPRPRSA